MDSSSSPSAHEIVPRMVKGALDWESGDLPNLGSTSDSFCGLVVKSGLQLDWIPVPALALPSWVALSQCLHPSRPDSSVCRSGVTEAPLPQRVLRMTKIMCQGLSPGPGTERAQWVSARFRTHGFLVYNKGGLGQVVSEVSSGFDSQCLCCIHRAVSTSLEASSLLKTVGHAVGSSIAPPWACLCILPKTLEKQFPEAENRGSER